MIRVGDPELAWIDVSEPKFLAREDILPIELSSRRSPCKAAVLKEETAYSRLSLETKIDQFYLEEERERSEKSLWSKS